MEPPAGPDDEALRDEKVRVLKSIRPPAMEGVVRGQFHGYRDEAGVAADSEVETFAALRLYLDSWRWQDVPFYIRAGKHLPVTATEVLVTLKPPPQHCFSGKEIAVGPPNHFRFRLGPDVEIAVGATVMAAGGQLMTEQRTPAGPLLAVSALGLARWFCLTRCDVLACLASAGFLGAMLVTAAFSVFPYALPTSTNPALGLTLGHAAAEPYALKVGLAWWIPGMVLVAAYFFCVYRQFAGKVRLDEEGHY